MLIWRNFDSFVNTFYEKSLLQKFHFPVEVVLNSLQTQKGPRTSFLVAGFADLENLIF